ncbi:MAG: hypothetical protein LBU39_01910 [Desulfobulbaceae bacterium]|jgi:hypothetical protein|nr:hypothetical protein [Desulfobulbaceae bacterium]
MGENTPDEQAIEVAAMALYDSGGEPPYGVEWDDTTAQMKEEFYLAARATIDAWINYHDNHKD